MAQEPKKIVPIEESKDSMTTLLEAADNTQYIPITKFGWDQTAPKVKIYITSGLDGVGSLPGGAVTCEFEDKSFDLRVQGLNGKNYRLRIMELQNRICIEDSKYQVKSNGVTITLVKFNKTESWTDLKPKKSLIGEKTSKGGSGDGLGDICLLYTSPSPRDRG